MATYVNDLRLKEIATGDESGTWGTSTNTNLELIAEGFSYATVDPFDTDADKTETMADGATDPIRSLYVKVTSTATLTATRTLTLAPNTVSKVWIIENATTGGQSINISQGSGSNVTIPNGDVKAIYTDGAGATAAVTDAFANLKVTDPAQTNITSVGTLSSLTVSGDATFDTSTLKVDSTNNRVGIGTTSPSYPLSIEAASPTLQLKSSNTTGANTILFSDSASAFVGNIQYNHTDNSLSFSTSSTSSERMRITSTGRVGIGDTSPDAELHVNGGTDNVVALLESTDATVKLGLKDNSTTNIYSVAIGAEGDEMTLSSGSGGAEAIRIDSSGNVGIGTTSPASLLHIESASAPTLRIDDSASVNALEIAQDGSNGSMLLKSSGELSIGVTNNSSSDAVSLKTRSLTRLYVKEDGNVGIGTSSPSANLHVSAASGDCTVLIEAAQNASGSEPRLQLKGTNTASNPIIEFGDSLAFPGSIEYENSDNSMRFSTNAGERVRIDSSGNVGINQTSPSQKLEVVGKIVATEGITTFAGDPTNYGLFRSGTAMQLKGASTMQIESGSGSNLIFYTNGANERMRIHSDGDTTIGTSTATGSFYNGASSITGHGFHPSGYAAHVRGGTNTPLYVSHSGTGSGTFVEFYQSTSLRGSITTNGSTTAYNTSSDYRLKENVVEMTGALDRVNQLQPKRFNFIADADTTVDGFIAHEVQDIVPEAIHGTKDEVDEEGNPVYQGIDQSKLVPLLTKAIQEQQVLIEQLQAEVALLKGE